MKRRAPVVAICLLSPACDCGGRIAGQSDAEARTDSAWSCGDPDAAPSVPQCSDSDKAKCRSWAQSLVKNGTGHSSCTKPPNGIVCARGDTCYEPTQSGVGC